MGYAMRFTKADPVLLAELFDVPDPAEAFGHASNLLRAPEPFDPPHSNLSAFLRSGNIFAQMPVEARAPNPPNTAAPTGPNNRTMTPE